MGKIKKISNIASQYYIEFHYIHNRKNANIPFDYTNQVLMVVQRTDVSYVMTWMIFSLWNDLIGII